MVGRILSGLLILGLVIPAAPLSAADEVTQETTQASKDESQQPLPSNALTLLEDYTGRNGVGVVFGAGSGIGLSYRRYLTNKFAVRGAGYVFHLKDISTLYSLGLLGQFDFRRDEHFVLYAVGGFAVSSASFPKTDNDFAHSGVFPAAGIGIELGDHEKVGMTYQLELALTGLFLDGEYKILLPLPQLGLHYVF